MERAQKKLLKIVIFCGGTGTRIWPMSRRERPKQFQPLVGKKSMFRQMVERLLRGFEPESLFVITGESYIPLVTKEAPEIPTQNLIVEPEMRDTLAAVGLATVTILKRFPKAIIATLWGADHIVKNDEVFIKALKAAYKVAQKERKIVNVDTRPTYPDTNLGYIEIGKMVGTIDGFEVFEIIRQVEKPNFALAQKFIKSFKFLWHVGYAVWQGKLMLSFYRRYQPQAYRALLKIKDALGTTLEQEILEKEYKKIPKTSVDYGILEKLKPGDQLDIPADLGWSDVGAWNILKDALSQKKLDNVIKGENIDIDSRDCLIYGLVDKKIIATVGLEGVVVVDTPDALLVCKKERASEVKKIVNELAKKRKDHVL